MILATVDIDEVATPKLRTFRNALDETAAAVSSFVRSATRLQGSTDGVASGDQISRAQALSEAYRSMGVAGAGSAAQAQALSRAHDAAARASAAAASAVTGATSATSAFANTIQRTADALTAYTTNLSRNSDLVTRYAQTEAASTAATEASVAAVYRASQAQGDLSAATLRVVDAKAREKAASVEATAAAARAALALAAVADAQERVVQTEQRLAAAQAQTRNAAGGDRAAAMAAEATAARDHMQAREDLNKALAASRPLQVEIEASAKRLARASAEVATAEAAQSEALKAAMAAREGVATTSKAAAEAATAQGEAYNALAGEVDRANEAHSEYTQVLGKIASNRGLQQAVLSLASGFSSLYEQMAPGLTVTRETATAVTRLGTQAQQAGLAVGPLQRAVASLINDFRPGATVTKEMQDNLAQVTVSLGGMANVAQQAGAGLQANTVSLLALGTALAAVTAGLTSYLSYATQLAARNQVLGTVMRVVGDNAGYAMGMMQGQVEVVKSLGITTRAATDAVIAFAQANLDVAQTSKLARVAQDLAVVAGKNSSEAFETLTSVIQTQQLRVLRSYGITKNLGVVMREYAREVGLTTNELESMDRQQAVLNLILKEGAVATGAYEKSMEDAGKKATSLARYQEELAASIGLNLVPAYGLWIDAQTWVLKQLIALPPALKGAAAAVATMTAAVTTLATLFVGAKWLAATQLFVGLKAAATSVAAAMTGATAAGGGLVAALGGPVTVGVLAAAAAIATLTGAYVYLSSEQDRARREAEAERSEFAKRQIDIQNLRDKIYTLGKQYVLTADDTRNLKDAIDELNQLTPTQEFKINEVTGALEVQTAALKENTAATAENARERVVKSRAIYDAAVKQLAALDKEDADAEAARNAASKASNASRLGLTPGALLTQRDDYLQAQRDRIRKGLEAARDTAKLDIESAAPFDPVTRVETARAEMANSLDQISKDFNMNSEKVLQIIKTEGGRQGAAAIRAWTELQERIRKIASGEVPEELLVKGVVAAPGVDEVRRVREQVIRAMASILDARDEKVKSREKAFKDSFESVAEAFNFSSAQVTGKLAGINKLLGEVSDADYGKALAMFGDDLLSVGESAELMKRRLENAYKGAQDFQKIKLQEWVDDQLREIDKVAIAVGETLRNSSVELAAGISQLSEEQSLKRAQAARETAEEVRKINEEVYEQEVVAYMGATDQIRYQEEKRAADAQRALNEYKRQKEEEIRLEEMALEEKIRISRAEVRNTIRTAETNFDIRREEAEKETVLFWGAKSEQARAQQALSEELRSAFRERMDDIEQDNLNEINQAEQTGKAIIAAERAALNQRVADHQAALDRQAAAGQRYVQQQIRDYGILVQAFRTIFYGIVDAAAKGYAGLVTQTLSFKEVFLGIWNSILKSISDIFDEVAKRYISAVQRSMGAGGGGFTWGGFGRALLGQGAATAAGAGAAAGAGSVDYAYGGATGDYGSAAAAAGGSVAARGLFQGYTSGTGFMTSAGGAALAGGGLGAIVGGAVASRYADGSYVKGVGSGAASGAAAGGAVGGWVGAGVGAIAGGLAGWWQARKQRKQMEEDRQAIIDNAGGLESLRLKAEEAGVSIDKMMATKSVKEFQREVNKLDAAFSKLEKDQLITAAGGAEAFREAALATGEFDQATVRAFINGTLSAERMEAVLERVKKALELKEAKDDLARTVTQMDALRKTAVLVGFDLRKLYDAKSIEEFNAQQTQLNKLLEAQKLRLDGLGAAAEGLAMRVQGLIGTYQKDLDDFVKGLSREQQDAWRRLLDDAKKGEESTATIVQQLRDAARDGLAGGSRVGDLQLSGAQGAELAAIIGKAEAAVADFGGAAAATFGGILRETGDIAAAFAAIADPLDALNAFIDETGIKAPEALQNLLNFREVVKTNQDVADSLGGLTMMIKGLSDGGQLTADVFNGLGRDVARQWDTLMGRNVDQSQALLLMQPTLQALYEAQKNFGFATDEATQKVIDLGIEQGIVGDQFQSINQKMLDILVIIAEAVGGVVPEAYRRQADAATGAAAAEIEAAQRTRAEQQLLADDINEVGAAAAQSAALISDTVGNPATWETDGPAGIAEDIAEMTRMTEEQFAEMAESLGVSVEELRTRMIEVRDSARGASDQMGTVDDQSLQTVTGEAKNVADAAYAISRAAEEATYSLIRMVDDTRGPLSELEDNVNAISLGRSPGGLKEIAIKADEGGIAIAAMGRNVRSELQALEDTATSYMSTVDAFIQQIEQRSREASTTPEETVNSTLVYAAPPERTAPSTESAPSPAQQLVIVQSPPVTVQITSLDPSKAADVWTNQIRPHLLKDLDTNNSQMATRVGRIVRRAPGAGRDV